MIRRIQVQYRLKLDAAKRDVAERVHGFHADYCAVARSIGDCVAISTSLEMEDL